MISLDVNVTVPVRKGFIGIAIPKEVIGGRDVADVRQLEWHHGIAA